MIKNSPLQKKKTIFKKLLKEYNPVSVSVRGISGGYGSTYLSLRNLTIYSLLDNIKWHGIHLTTKKLRKPKEQ